MAAKPTGLSQMNVLALREVFPDLIEDGDIVLTATTAKFRGSPAFALGLVVRAISELPGRGHPRASLHAVARRLAALPPEGV